MKLCIVGLGIQEIAQLTLKGLEHLKEAKHVLVLPVVADGAIEALKELGVHSCESLKPLYHSGSEDVDNYRRIYEFVIKACAQHGGVALLIPGHPRIGVTLVQWFENHQTALKLELIVIEGISSFCSMINDLARDPIEKGSVILDANRLLLLRYKMEPALDHYIYHVCSIGTSQVHVDDPSKENRIDSLQSYLLQFFSPQHRMELVSSSNQAGGKPERYAFNLENMSSILSRVHFGTTLFIPGARPRGIDREYLELLSGPRAV